MKNTDRCETGGELDPLDALLTADERRPCTVEKHLAFRESLAPRKPLDPIDELVADLRATQPEGFDR